MITRIAGTHRAPRCSIALLRSHYAVEVLVHTDPDLIPDNLIWSSAALPADPEVLDRVWNIGDFEQTRAFGKEWIASRRSLAIRVPSVIVPHTDVDFNILVNPAHDAFSDIVWQRGERSLSTPRLFFNEASI